MDPSNNATIFRLKVTEAIISNNINTVKFKMDELRLSLQEKIEIVLLVGDNIRSYRAAAAEFNQRHPNRQQIQFVTVGRIFRAFSQTGKPISNLITQVVFSYKSILGCVTTHDHNRGIRNGPNANNRQNANDETILDFFRTNPHSSVRDAGRVLNLPKSTIWRVLKIHKLKPFKAKFLNTLEPGDDLHRLEYCLWMQGNFLNNRNFLKKILYTDEATFTTNGIVCSQNTRQWAQDNPNFTIECKRQYSFKINVFCGILNETIIGPFFFRENLNGERFLHFLNNNFWNAIEELPLLERLNLHVQLDGAPIHNTREVRHWLDQHFPQKWIGRQSTLIRWPPRSPDLTPLDFYFWGRIKNIVYKTRPQNVDELCLRIRAACREITRVELKNVLANNIRRIEKCILLNGGQVEKTKI